MSASERVPLHKGAIIRIEKRRSLYRIEGADAIDGGGYRLHLRALDDESWSTEECYRHRDGEWRTEQLEGVSKAFEGKREKPQPVAVALATPVPESAPAGPAPVGDGQLELF